MKTINKLTIMLVIMSGLVVACSSDDEEENGGKGLKGKHEYVDLGLPSGTLWATCNVGANSPEEYGDYFAWGETLGYNSGKTEFNWYLYKWCDGSYDSQTKYSTYYKYGIVDKKTELDYEDDAAYMNWGVNWRMPSKEQFDELVDSNYTSSEWSSLNSINGYKIISKTNGNTIFLPVAGYREDSSLRYAGSSGHYWSRTLNYSKPYYACELIFYSGFIGRKDDVSTYGHPRCGGRSVRPVQFKE